MFSKDLSISLLLDFYGDILQDKQKRLLEKYYNDDLSLAEIAEEESISRQAVRQSIKKNEEYLHFLEDKLHLASTHILLEQAYQKMQLESQKFKENPERDCSKLLQCLEECMEIIEQKN